MGSLVLVALLLGVVGVLPHRRWVVIGAVITSGIPVGLNNTLVTTAVMSVSPVAHSVSSAAYGFVRFVGGGLAPWIAGQLVERFNRTSPSCRPLSSSWLVWPWCGHCAGRLPELTPSGTWLARRPWPNKTAAPRRTPCWRRSF